ncbi:Growth hormone-regulated TBC protein 1 [Phytophthora nicotianae]|nr:Growth hormone-regulated TBC protein 1 [Phytophthora nicotianae]
MRLAAATGVDSVSSAPKESVTDSSWPGIPTRGSGPTTNCEWSMPTLLQVGTIEGTLNDVMYGSASFDAVGTLIKSSYTAEEVVDAETLYELQGPTSEEPFRFLGIKWVVKSTSSTVKAFVWPRDLTFIAATGILTRQGGERVGYHLMHSVDLGKGYGPLEGKRIVRGRISSCYLYRQTSSNTVDVYMKTNFEPNGSVHESVALLSAANSLTYCLKSSLCAQNKKLSWLLAHPKIDDTEAGSARPSTVRIKKRNDCGVCTRPIGTFSRCHTCRVCNARACSTCFVKKKLSFPGQGHKTVEQRSVVICTHCLTHARKLNSLEIAEKEVIERQQMNRRRGTLRTTGSSTRSIRSRSNSRPDINRRRRGTVTGPSANEQEKIENEKVFHTAPVRRVSRTPRQTHSQRKLDSNTKPAWDYNSETEDIGDEKDTVVSSNTVLLPVDSEPRKTRARDTRTRSNSRKTITMQNLSKNDAEIPVVDHPDVWDVDSDTDEVDYLVSSQEVPILGETLPEAVVQYAWGAVVPSPTNKEAPATSASWPSPPSSPLPSPTPLPKEKEDSWPTAQGERASVWTPPISQPTTIPRIHAGASTQEVLAQFAELCNAAENVYQAARKHTITHLDPTVLPTRQNNTRLDMSAVD